MRLQIPSIDRERGERDEEREAMLIRQRRRRYPEILDSGVARKRKIGPSESTGIAYERVGAATKNVLLFAFQTYTKNQWV